MVTVTVPIGAAADMPHGKVIARMIRQGFPSERLIVDVKVTELAMLRKGRPIGDPGLEYIFDY